MSVLRCKDLSVGYGVTPVATGIDFEIINGCRLAIVGSNGCGKSTLSKTIAGLIPAIDGGVMTRGKVAYVPQISEEQADFPATVLEVAMMGMSLRDYGFLRMFFKKEAYSKALNQLEQFGIRDLAYKSFKSLSGGQKQKVLIARALLSMNNPHESILLLDEPTKGLDANSAQALYKIQNDFSEAGGIVAVVTHDLANVSKQNFDCKLTVGETSVFKEVI